MPMLTISDDTRVRVYAYLQQADVPFVHVGDVAEVSDASNPERKKTATVTRMTGELDAEDPHHADRGPSRQPATTSSCRAASPM